MEVTFAPRGILQINDARIILEILEEKDQHTIVKVIETLQYQSIRPSWLMSWWQKDGMLRSKMPQRMERCQECIFL